MDGGCYSVVPADIDPGGGFCVSLDRDFAGETNMSSMLYLRKKPRKERMNKSGILRVSSGSHGQTNRITAAAARGAAAAAGTNTPHAAAFASSKVRVTYTEVCV